MSTTVTTFPFAIPTPGSAVEVLMDDDNVSVVTAASVLFAPTPFPVSDLRVIGWKDDQGVEYWHGYDVWTVASTGSQVTDVTVLDNGDIRYGV